MLKAIARYREVLRRAGFTHFYESHVDGNTIKVVGETLTIDKDQRLIVLQSSFTLLNGEWVDTETMTFNLDGECLAYTSQKPRYRGEGDSYEERSVSPY